MLAAGELLSVCGHVLPQGENGCLVIDAASGRIAEWREEPPAGAERLAMDAVILPGLVDMHVHLRGLNLSYKEDEETGTMAAARGGLTLVADMPNTSPAIRTPSAAAAKLSRLRRLARVEYRLYLGVPPTGMVDEMISLARRLPGEIAGFKVYPEDLEERGEQLARILSTPRLLVVVHPELQAYPRGELVEDEHNRESHRSCWLEMAAVELLAAYSPEARIHITHASCPETVEKAKRHGFTVDVTPHHLLLQPPRSPGCLYRVNPPLREPERRQRLLQLLLEGLVDAVASDHAPHAAREKNGDPLACPPGIPWLEHWPAMLYCLVTSGALAPGEFTRLASTVPASLLDAGRCTEPGCPATLTVIEPAWERAWAPRHSKARLLPYRGARLCARVKATLVRGQLVYRG